MQNKKQIGYVIKIAVILLLFGAIWYKVANNQNIIDIKEIFANSIQSRSGQQFLLMALLLMPINWIIESRKWQILINKLFPISLGLSLKAILAGVTVSVFTPNRIGEYAGRVLLLQHTFRLQAAVSTIISSLGQIIATIVFGSLSFYFYYLEYVNEKASLWVKGYLLALLLVLIGALFALFISTPTLLGLLKKIKVLKRFKKYVSFFNRYTLIELVKILGLSFVRYSVYTFQFYLLLQAFQVEIDVITSLILIPLIYFTMTIIPSIALAELGIREVVALSILGSVTDNHIGILSATFLLWFINLVIPAIVGSVLIFKSKIFSSK